MQLTNYCFVLIKNVMSTQVYCLFQRKWSLLPSNERPSRSLGAGTGTGGRGCAHAPSAASDTSPG